MSTYYISKSCVWIIVSGGYRECNRSLNAFQPLTGCDVTVIIELGMIIITHIMSYIIVYTNEVVNLINNYIINYV